VSPLVLLIPGELTEGSSSLDNRRLPARVTYGVCAFAGPDEVAEVLRDVRQPAHDNSLPFF
jgi:hypothetical protein